MDAYTRMVEVLRAEGITPDDVLNLFGDRAAAMAANYITHPIAGTLRERATRLWQAADAIRRGADA